MYRIDQLGTILRAVSRTGAILIGGQAVNLWSERYQREAERLALAARLRHVFSSAEVESWVGCFVLVTDRKIRVHRAKV